MGKFATTATTTAIIFVVFLAGCATGGSSGSGSDPQRMIEISQATIGAAEVAINKTAQAEAVATAQAQQATAQHWQQSTAVAGQATAQAQAAAEVATRDAEAQAQALAVAAEQTRQGLEVQQTAVALQMAIDESTRQAEALNYAAAVTIQAEQTRETQRAENWKMAQTLEIERARSAQFWANARQGLLIAFGIAAIIVLFILAYAALARVRKVNDEPVKQFRDDAQNVNILVMPSGLFSSDIRTIGRPSQPQISAPDQPLALLPAPQPVYEIKPIDLGHMLFAGGSGSGKSSLMRWAIQHRKGDVVVVDPHAAMDEWNADRVIGRGGKFDEIAEYFLWMEAELRERMAIRGRARRPDEINFAPLTVATDELPAIVSTLGNDGKKAWIEWIEQGRKFGLFVILASQSTRVKSLGISGKGDLRDQFSAVVSLGSEALRRFPDLADGMTRPAILELENSPNPQRVTIPYIPPFQGARNGNGADFTAYPPGGPVVVEQQHLQEPAQNGNGQTAETAVDGMETDGGFVPADEVQKIIQHWASLDKPSLRKVAKAIYSSTGGKGFYKSRAVLEAHGFV